MKKFGLLLLCTLIGGVAGLGIGIIIMLVTNKKGDAEA